MGIIRQGILGGFTNKTGSVVGAYWRTLDVIRGLPRKTGKQPSQKQKDQQLRFALITGFLSWFSGLIHTGFSSVAKVTTPMNVAVRYHLAKAIIGVFPNYSINYPEIKFSVGRLRKVNDIGIDALAGAKLKFTWTHNYGNDRHGDGSDLASFMVYNPAKNEFVVLEDAVSRAALTFNLQLPADFANDQVHCYMSFRSVITEGLTSESVYRGPMDVIE